jgi:hypothetical protein
MPTRTAKVPRGERHNHLCDLGLRLVRAGVLDQATIVRALQAEYQENCAHDPPAKPTEFTSCADWALDTRIAERERSARGHSGPVRARRLEGGAVRAAEDMTVKIITAQSKYQVIEDKDAIRVTLAVAATSVLDDEPLWLQHVGGPSSGKSEMIAMLREIADGRIGEITVAGLLGWTGNARNGRPTGLLSRIGAGRRLVTITDFSTVLADSDRGRRATLFSFLRTLYDGYAIREINSAPRPLEWEGRLTIVSGVTPQIDAFSAHADALGPRWMYCRVPELSREGRKKAAKLARKHASTKQKLRAEVREKAATAISRARENVVGIAVNDIDGDWLEDGAIVAALGRADVPRDGYGRREIIGEATREEPPRVTIMLTILFRGLVALGVPPRTSRRIALRCAIDSIPLTRRRVLDALSGGETLNTSAIARRTGADRKVARFALEELELLGVVESKRDDVAAALADDHPDARETRARNWKLTGEDGKLVADVLGEARRNVEYLSPSPPLYREGSYGSSHPQTASATDVQARPKEAS